MIAKKRGVVDGSSTISHIAWNTFFGLPKKFVCRQAELCFNLAFFLRNLHFAIYILPWALYNIGNFSAKEKPMLNFILKRAVPIPKLTNFNSFLFVGPHPDDIEVACGGTVAKLTKLGKKVRFLVATNGCVGSLDESLTSDQIVQTRRQEALKSAHLLGVDDVVFLSHNDGNDYDLEAMKRDFVACILDFQPQVVFCPDYTVPSECHPDHVNVGKVATESVFVATWQKLTSRLGLQGSCPAPVLAYYYTHKPNCYVGVGKTYKLQRQAMACHVSQFDQATLNSFNTYFSAREICFGMRCFKRRAEGFRVLAPVHQHCFPEASNW